MARFSDYNYKGKSLVSGAVSSKERFFLICNKLTKKYMRMSEYDTLPANFEIVRKINNVTCYGLDGQLKEEFMHFTKFDYLKNREEEQHYLRTMNIPTWLNHRKLSLIKRVGENEYFLWQKELPCPEGFVSVTMLQNRPVYFDGLLRDKYLRYPVHPTLRKGNH
jgi:hypothetical protein